MSSKLTQLANHFTLAWYGILIACVLLTVTLSALNSTSLQAVRIKLKEGQKEHMDKSIPFVTKPGEELPDYRVSYLMQDRWHTIGTRFNTSATKWLEFSLSDPPNMTLVQGLRIVDEDAAEHDKLEEIQLTKGPPTGALFDYEVVTTHSFKAGMSWFATTPLGMVIFGAIGLAVFLAIASSF